MNKTTLIAVTLASLIGLGAGFMFGAGDQSSPTVADAGAPLFYRNPMNPAITSPVAAKDEMGMDYIPVYANDGAVKGPAGTVTIDPVTSHNMGVRTALVVQKPMTRDIRTVGRVDYDERLVTRLSPKVEGWVEELFVDETGTRVTKDTMLLSLYAPNLVATEEEYLLALNNLDTLQASAESDIRDGAKRLADAALSRLKLLDVPEHQLHVIATERRVIKDLHIHSPFDGVVVAIGARQGQFVTPKTELYTIADLTRVWVYVDIYEDEIPWAKGGDRAEMTVTGVPGRTFHGTVTYIYPYLDPKTRTNKVRLEFDNVDRMLKPEMFAHVTLRTSRRIDAIVVPSEAIIRTGAREQLFVAKGEGRFEPREVVVGVTTAGETQIVRGVEPGERVVTSAQFLIDSESKLNEATAKMIDPGTVAPPLDDDMSMEGMRLSPAGAP